MDSALTTSSLPRDALVRFLRVTGDAFLTLAREIEQTPNTTEGVARPLHTLGLGSLQNAVAKQLITDDDEAGVSPREITRQLDRDDEPNIRTALASLRSKGVAELLPGGGPQRWRIAERYRLAT
jgi:hypothetical protein